MSIQSDTPAAPGEGHGFLFPGTFELSAMGPADKHLEQALPRELQAAGIDVVSEQINWRHSSSGKFVSVRIAFNAASREEYDRAHEALRAHPDVKWTV